MNHEPNPDQTVAGLRVLMKIRIYNRHGNESGRRLVSLSSLFIFSIQSNIDSQFHSGFFSALNRVCKETNSNRS